MIQLTADTPCDIGEELQERYHVALTPLYINLEGKDYTDGKDIVPQMLYDAWYQRKALPKTAAGGVEDYLAFFRQFTEQGLEVLHISLGSGISAAYQNAVKAAEKLTGVTVFDSRNLSSGYGHLVCEAGERVKKGARVDEIISDLTALRPCVRASFCIDTLEFLHAGGRCSTLAKIGANLLNLKPSIVVKESMGGAMTTGKKYTGRIEKVLRKYTEDLLKDRDDIVLDRVFITDSTMDPAVENDIRELVLSLQPFREVHITHASSTISCHCGPNTLGVLFLVKTPDAK